MHGITVDHMQHMCSHKKDAYHSRVMHNHDESSKYVGKQFDVTHGLSLEVLANIKKTKDLQNRVQKGVDDF